MSSTTPGGQPLRAELDPAAAAAASTRPTVAVTTFTDYVDAQRAVDFLSDNGFPVERVEIVGSGLQLVEKVLGRVTVGRAALAGAASGAWFGLFLGLLFGIFTVGDWWAVILAGLLIGAFWGAIFGAVAHAMTRGERDFSSASTLRAAEYGVVVDAEYAHRARELLARRGTV